MKIIQVTIAITFALLVFLASTLYADIRYNSTGADARLTGTVCELSYDNGDFLLKNRSSSYIVLADMANVQLNGGKITNLRDLKDKAFVRVFGERLSQRTVLADTIIVLDDEKYSDLSLGSGSYVGEDIDVVGRVTHVTIKSNEVIFRTDSSSYVVNPGIFTLITRFGYITDIYDIFIGDTIRVTGTSIGYNRIDAIRIEVIGSSRGMYDYGPYYNYGPRDDIIFGIILESPRRPGESCRVRTRYGIREIRLPDYVDSSFLGQITSGKRLCVSGHWKGETLFANKLDIQIDRKKSDKADTKKTVTDEKNKSSKEDSDTNSTKPADEKNSNSKKSNIIRPVF